MKAKAKPKPRKPAPELPAAALQLLEPSQIAAALRVSARELRRLIAAREYPGPDMHVGRLPRWRVATHNSWVNGKGK